MHAESAYLFRHALLRDAAYTLHVPSERAVLHELALLLIEQVLGGRPAPVADLSEDPPHHTADIYAAELATHARNAGDDYARVQVLYLHRAAAYAEAQYESAEAERLWLSLAELGPRMEGLLRAGAVAFHAGRVASAEPMLTEALQLARDAGRRRAEGRILSLLAVLLSETGRMEPGREMAEQALEIHAEIGNRAAEAGALSDLGGLHFTTGKPQTAIEFFQRALAIQRGLPDPRAPITCLTNLGIAWAEIHEYAKAEECNLEALALARKTGDRRNEGVALGNLGLIWMDGGKRERVEAAFIEALQIHREVGHRRFEGVNECDFALCLWLFRREQEARDHFTRGMEILREINEQVEMKHQIRRMHHVCKQTGADPPLL